MGGSWAGWRRVEIRNARLEPSDYPADVHASNQIGDKQSWMTGRRLVALCSSIDSVQDGPELVTAEWEFSKEGEGSMQVAQTCWHSEWMKSDERRTKVDVVAQGSQAAGALTEMWDESMVRGRCKQLPSNRKSIETPRTSFDSRLSLSSNGTQVIMDVAHSSGESSSEEVTSILLSAQPF
jgi:hypothetical protein